MLRPSTNLVILVVLYRMAPEDSPTLQSLGEVLRRPGGFSGRVVVWDNSPDSFGADSISGLDLSGFDRSYIACPENFGLAKVYNTVSGQVPGDLLLILDQDSMLPDGFLEILDREVSSNPACSLFLPVVESNGRCVSPGRLRVFKGKHVSVPQQGVRSPKDVLAISSGMVIRYGYLQQPRFDERLTLYGIDTRFMIDFADNEWQLVVMPSVIRHDTALWSDMDADGMLWRIRSLIRSWPVVFERRPLARMLSWMYARYVLAKLAIKYRDIRFLYVH
ncbi:glycosyltransferase [Stenotrophomonas geniculata]|uniref:glycosyltransferase n=1 Tax=Stenotrophomonas geniculata TaxID=86188 RepID=UPI002E794F33|nr:glycosyltransferase [Stenotrophomonas geniculata]